MGGCRRIHVYLWGLKMEVGSTWVNFGCDMALSDGEFDLGSLGDLCIHWVDYL